MFTKETMTGKALVQKIADIDSKFDSIFLNSYVLDNLTQYLAACEPGKQFTALEIVSMIDQFRTQLQETSRGK